MIPTLKIVKIVTISAIKFLKLLQVDGRMQASKFNKLAELVSKHKKTHDFLLDKQFGEKMEGLKLQRSFLLNLEEETLHRSY